ncbi:MAG TPA: hypothetical protein VII12_14655 [Thermoanaerobaculia bacterium]
MPIPIRAAVALVGNTFTPAGEKQPSWAWLQSGGAQLMVARVRMLGSGL